VSDQQRNELVSTIRPPAAGGLAVYVALWPKTPTRDPKPPAVLWVDGNQYRYLPPQDARRFAAALVEAADQIDHDASDPATGDPPGHLERPQHGKERR